MNEGSYLKKRIIYLIIISILTTVLASCGTTRQRPAILDYDYNSMRLVQLEEPYEGQPIAIIETTLGIIKVALYPEYAPETVQNFIDRIEEGFYDDRFVYAIPRSEHEDYDTGVLFHSGAADELFREGKTTSGEPIENEYSVNLWPFKGALVAFGGIQGQSDSRFVIINGEPFGQKEMELLREVKRDGERLIPEKLLTELEKHGCLFQVAGLFTVYGQTIEGLDVVEAICALPVDERTQPLSEILIEKITLEYYNKD